MFEGFQEQTMDFLWGIRFNNSWEWFDENKTRYQEYLYKPMKELALALWEQMTQDHKLSLNCHVSRIHRDARRTHGKGPFKDRLWFSLRGDSEDWTGAPVFYFELSPEGYAYGLGYYAPRPATLVRFRASIDEHPGKFEAIARALEKQTIFVIDGEEYKKKKGDKPGPLSRWYNLKSPGMTAQRPVGEELFSPEFSRHLYEELSLLVPLYQYLRELDFFA